MSPLSPFQMSLSSPGGCWERVTDDGDCDEPHGDRPDARAQGSGGWPVDYPDGRLAIKHNGRELPYRTFDRRQQVNQAAVVENRRLGPVLAYIAERQKALDMSRSKKAPRRQGQRNHMFKVG